MINAQLDDITKQVKSLLNQKKETEAFEILVKAYNQKIYWHIRRIVLDHDDTNDIVQNTYIKVWKSLYKFKGNSKIYTWIYRIATNESLSFLKKKKKQPMSIEAIQVNKLQTNIQIDVLNGNEILFKLEKAIAILPTKQRIVFNLKYFEELKYSEIATITTTSIGALKASYHLAVKKIEKYLTSH
jgi:RNA polymerase sigma-70 factor (ECF subfamily)